MDSSNYSAASNNMKWVHWPLMGGLLHLIQRGGNWAGPQPAEAHPRCTKCNSPCTLSTASVPITVLLYNGPLLCGFNVPIKGLTELTDITLFAVLTKDDDTNRLTDLRRRQKRIL